MFSEISLPVPSEQMTRFFGSGCGRLWFGLVLFLQGRPSRRYYLGEYSGKGCERLLHIFCFSLIEAA